MLIQEQEENYTRPNYFKYVKGELHLVLTKDGENSTWKYRQDIQDNTPILRSKVYTFGEIYGILTKKEDENHSRLNVHGLEYQLTTLPNNAPILKTLTQRRGDYPKYLRLEEVYAS